MKKSIWENYSKQFNFPKINKDISCDILIIGGGISGISLAYELSQYFSNIVLAEQNTLISGATLYTTAKITVQHDDIYQRLIKKHNKKDAYNYYKANLIGLERIKEIVKNNNIDCDLEEVNSYLYSDTIKGDNILEKELESYKALGISGSLLKNKKINDNNNTFLEIKNMYQFNPVKYLNHLVETLKDKVCFYENTKIVETTTNEATTHEGHKINAKYIISAAGYPLYKYFNLFFTKLKSAKSYLLCGKRKIKIDDGVYIKVTNPVITMRSVNFNNQDYYIFGGYSYDSSDAKKIIQDISSLKNEANKVINIEYFFDNEDYISVDDIPFIGKINDTTFITTGYGKWGMTNSVFASILITDLIRNKENSLSYLFDPKRIVCNINKIKYNLKTIKTLIEYKLTIKNKIKSLKKDEGTVCKYRGKVLAIYKDNNGNVSMFNGKCPHLKCNLYYNNIQKSFDCPCHGSRFDNNGRNIFGPSRQDLQKILLDEI